MRRPFVFVLCVLLSPVLAAAEGLSVNLLPNPGFEVSNVDAPTRWMYSGPPARCAESWPDSGGRGGGRFLRFAAIRDHQSWECGRVAIVGGRPYRLEWWNTLAGTVPWHWTTHTGFVGVRVIFFDVAGDRCGIYERRIRSIGTDDWVRAWVRFTPPAEASSCTVAFVCEADIRTDGVVGFDDALLVAADDMLLPPDEALGVLRGVVRADGRPSGARLIVTASDGKRYAPVESYRFLDGTFHTLDGRFALALPPGPATVVAMRGFDRAVWRDTVEIRAGEAVGIAPDLPRVNGIDGWRSGDAHIHLFFHRHTIHPQMVPATVMDLARAEGLDWLSFKGEEKEAREFIAHGTPWIADGFTGEVGIEAVSDFHGHVYTVNARTVPADGFPMKLVAWPMNADLSRGLRETGGAIVYAHPLSDLRPDRILADLADPAKLLNAREWPVDLALGETPAYDILCPEGPSSTADKLTEYYRMLNCGFRSGVSASTDGYIDQARIHPGAARTYVRADSLTWDAIADAYRRGATFATNGPVILLAVNGEEPGDDVSIGRAGEVNVEFRAASNWGLIRAEIVVNGEVAHTATPGPDGVIAGTARVRMPASGWIALRVFGPKGDEVQSRILPKTWQEEGVGQFAHTSPVYVSVAGRPMRPDPAAARHYADWIAAYRTSVLASPNLFANENGTWGDDVKRAIIERLDAAERVFRGKASRSGR